ncbi:MAG TPA: DUF624 domain-containing protein [Bacillota bacterium]|nr:DUF624 domain-containing protein [Bacillota bacterium]
MGKLFNFFTGNNLNGKGISKNQASKDAPLNFVNYFKMLFRRFGVVITGNLLFLLCNFPLFICFFGYLGYFNDSASAPFSPFYANLYGAEQISGTSGALAALNGVLGTTRTVGIVSDTTQILMYLGFLTVFTFGFANVGLTCLSRSCVRREPLETWNDFWSSIKKNAKQGFALGLFDCAVMIIIVFDAWYFRQMSSDFTYAIMYYILLSLGLIFVMMRPYMYILATTFKYKLKQIISYSLRLSMLGLKRNFLALLMTGLMAYITVLLFSLNPVVGVFFPLFFTFGIINFTGTYAAYPVALKYLLEKKKDEDKSNEVDYDDDDDPVFKDRD